MSMIIGSKFFFSGDKPPEYFSHIDGLPHDAEKVRIRQRPDALVTAFIRRAGGTIVEQWLLEEGSEGGPAKLGILIGSNATVLPVYDRKEYGI